MMESRLATTEETDSVEKLYHSLTDAMQGSKFDPGWRKGVYPTREFLQRSVENGEMYVATEDGRTVSCMVVNHESNEGYNNVEWSVDVSDAELLVIHALGVHPEFSGRGIAKQMVRKVFDIAAERNVKTVRLDVLDGNIPAEKAYVKMGFVCRGTAKMFYEDTGLTDYKLFEYLL